MRTRFDTGEKVYIPATITGAYDEDGKIYYHIKESGLSVAEDLCRTEDDTISHQTAKAIVHIDCAELDEAKEKIKRLEEAMKTANSLLDELAAKEVTVRVSSD